MENIQVDSKRKWLVLVAVSTGIFMAVLDGSIVNIALPWLETELHADFAVVQWVVLAYMLTIVTLMLTIGRLADMFGKKPLFVAGYILFVTGSTLCGFSQSIHMLIGFRVLQAAGAVMIIALGTAITTEAFPPQERGKALGITGLTVSLGGISGPALGGILLGITSWHWIFWINVPIGIIGVILVLRFVPNLRPTHRQKFDFPGAAALFVSLFSLLMAVTIGQTDGFGSPIPLGLFAGFALFLGIFAYIEMHTAEPVVDFTLFRNWLFTVNLVTGFITFVCSNGFILLLTFYLQNARGFDPMTAGLLLAVVPVSMGIIAPFSGALSDRFGTRPLTVIGLGMLLVGYILVRTLSLSTSPLFYILVMAPLGLGAGIFQSPNNSAVMGSAPRSRLGVASSLLSLTRSTGQTIGVSVIGGLWASQAIAMYGKNITDATQTPPVFQIAALHQTTLVIIVLIGLAFLLSLQAFVTEIVQRRKAVLPRQISENLD